METHPGVLWCVQVIKKTGVQMKQRLVPAAAVEHWQQRTEGLEYQVCGEAEGPEYQVRARKRACMGRPRE